MQKQNTITVAQHNFVVKGNDRPFSNDFVQNSAKIVDGEIHAHVTCTPRSREPGRTYFVAYSMQGKMLGCFTTN